jgi:hypothetical protein
LGVEAIHLLESAELVSGETSVTICITVRRAEIAGKKYRNRERERERERESKGKVEEGQII